MPHPDFPPRPNSLARLALGVDPCACGRFFGPGEECMVPCGVCQASMPACTFHEHAPVCPGLAPEERPRTGVWRRIVQRVLRQEP
jgi:hypothetical protein